MRRMREMRLTQNFWIFILSPTITLQNQKKHALIELGLAVSKTCFKGGMGDLSTLGFQTMQVGILV